MAQENNIIDFEEEEDFTFPDDAKRPGIDPGSAHKFLPEDEVTLKGDPGRYLVEKAEGGKYSLCDKEGNTVHGGKLYQESELTLYNPFARAS